MGKPLPASYQEGDAAAIFNELVNLLFRQRPLPEPLGETLVRVASSTTAAPLIRDYALQQMVYVWWREPRLPQREAIEKALWQAIKQPEREMAGSALLALARLFLPPRASSGLDGKPLTSLDVPESPDAAGRQVATVTSQEVSSEILKILRNKKSHPAVRVSAMRAGVMLGAPQLPEEALKIAADPQRELQLRMAAISAAGFVGNPDLTTKVLSKLSENPLLKPATDEALKMLGLRIKAENGQR
ncbi:hypothetical protein [Roseimicrobium gellanilyticum]|uniref:hypothetical protein n=1 Tax=Roseimicrobium gellanilyticum TaxID=748857 RepID=UPI0011BE39BC|nr:hypothetical protein [Roseimicrobium gellanilyticum]